MTDAVIFDGLRSPFGRHVGTLAMVRPDDLLAAVIAGLVGRAGCDPSLIEDVIVGCACQAGEDSRNVARHAGLLAGLPVATGGLTVNRLCGSGLAAVLDAARCVRAREGELLVAGGVESMTRAPFVLAKAESAFGREAAIFDSSIGARFPNPKLTATFGADAMPETAENVARELGIGRDEAGRFAARSQALCQAAKAGGFFADEILPMALPARGEAAMMSEDEHPRPGTDLAALARLRPLRWRGARLPWPRPHRRTARSRRRPGRCRVRRPRCPSACPRRPGRRP
jgi:acetyl-CoA C-acetyltransferase